MTQLYAFELYLAPTLWSRLNLGASILVDYDLYLEAVTFKETGTLDLAVFHCDPKGLKPFTSTTLQTPPNFRYQTSDGLLLAGPLSPKNTFWATWKIALLAL
jgi:hypothetical protein